MPRLWLFGRVLTADIRLEGLCNLLCKVLIVGHLICNLTLLGELHTSLADLAFGAVQSFSLAVEEVTNVVLIWPQEQPLAVLVRQVLSKLQPSLDQR